MTYPAGNRTAPLLIKALFVLVPLSLVFLVVLSSAVTSLEYRIGDLERRKSEAGTARKALEAELAVYTARERVEERALPLEPPDRRKVFYVMKDGSGAPQTVSFRRWRTEDK